MAFACFGANAPHPHAPNIKTLLFCLKAATSMIFLMMFIIFSPKFILRIVSTLKEFLITLPYLSFLSHSTVAADITWPYNGGCGIIVAAVAAVAVAAVAAVAVAVAAVAVAAVAALAGTVENVNSSVVVNSTTELLV